MRDFVGRMKAIIAGEFESLYAAYHEANKADEELKQN